MNSGTLVGSLIFAAVLVVVIALVIQLMMRGWRHRAQRQAELIGELPDVPDMVGAAAIPPAACIAAARWRRTGRTGSRSAIWATAARRC